MKTWREKQRENYRDWKILCDHLELDAIKRQSILYHSQFPLNLPSRLAEKIEKNCLDDPILLQFLPLTKESEEKEGFSVDPVMDTRFRKEKKLLQKYRGRVLLTVTSSCAMHCRFCFRQNFDYDTTDPSFDSELKAIAQDATISEVILSGGDPLSLSNQRLESLVDALSQIPHLKRLRIHTRFPIGIPERIDKELLAIFQACKLSIFFVIHANHPKELDSDVLSSLKKIHRLGIPVLNQSVLLKGVNNHFETLKILCETLVNHGIMPYYLHQLDRVIGSWHFEVEESEGLSLIEELKKSLPGYAVPKYVKEIPGESAKTQI